MRFFRDTPGAADKPNPESLILNPNSSIFWIWRTETKESMKETPLSDRVTVLQHFRTFPEIRKRRLIGKCCNTVTEGHRIKKKQGKPQIHDDGRRSARLPGQSESFVSALIRVHQRLNR